MTSVQPNPNKMRFMDPPSGLMPPFLDSAFARPAGMAARLRA